MVLRIKAVLIALGLHFAACDAASTSTPAADPPAQVEDTSAPDPTAVDRIDQNLARLAALDVVVVGELLTQVPDHLANCYCSQEIREHSAATLERLADVAVAAAALPPAACEAATVDAHLAALEDLAIVQVHGLVADAPANNPMCYNLPCADDIAAAEAANCARAGRLVNIAAAAVDAFDAPPIALPLPDDDALATVDANLARLAALEVFEVGALLVDYPEGAFSCYGPCPGTEGAIAQAEVTAAVRLARFADRAEATAALDVAVDETVCAAATVDQNLALLAALEIVEVGDLLAVAAANNPMCYNFPCAEDIAAAEAATCDRAKALALIAKGTSDL